MGSNNSTGSFAKGSESSMSRTSKAASTRSISIKGGRSGIPWSVKLVKVGSDSEHQGLSKRITSRVRRFPVCLLHKLGKRNFRKGMPISKNAVVETVAVSSQIKLIFRIKKGQDGESARHIL